MLDVKLIAAGTVGVVTQAVGTAMAPTEVLQIISLILTIIGTIITFIIIPLVNWYKRSKADGKITVDEIKEGAEILGEGIGKTVEKIEENSKTAKKD